MPRTRQDYLGARGTGNTQSSSALDQKAYKLKSNPEREREGGEGEGERERERERKRERETEGESERENWQVFRQHNIEARYKAVCKPPTIDKNLENPKENILSLIINITIFNSTIMLYSLT